MEKATAPQFPRLPSAFKVSDEILGLGGTIAEPSQEMLDADPKLAYLWSKYGIVTSDRRFISAQDGASPLFLSPEEFVGELQ